MKHKVSVLLVVGLLAGLLTLPAYASENEVEQETQIIHTQYGEIQVDTALTVQDLTLYSNTKSAEKTATYRYDGSVIAKVTLEATFGYDGQTAWVDSADASHVTYGGWSYGSERIYDSGNRARVTAELSRLLAGDVPVDISITCTPSGQIS